MESGDTGLIVSRDAALSSERHFLGKYIRDKHARGGHARNAHAQHARQRHPLGHAVEP